MEQITAKCPQCKTQYQLTQEQLSIADGQVRCGACMNIFHAIPLATPTNSPERPSNFIINDEELINDGIDEKPSVENDSFVTNFEEIQSHSDEFGAIEDDEIEQDEEWAEQLLRELEEEESQEKKGEDLTNKNTEHKQPDNADIDTLLSDELDDLEDFEAILTLKEDIPVPNNKIETTLTADKNDILERIEPEPIEFLYRGRKKLGKRIILFLLFIALSLTAAGQFFFFQFDELSRSNQWRPFYRQVCSIMDCNIPSQEDISRISASHIHVKSHPYLSNILIADTILTNHATFNQPFPNLELLFTDINQNVIAGRIFTPNEYLKGELTNTDNMPQRQPVHIAIELVDPGSSATGYFIQLKPST